MASISEKYGAKTLVKWRFNSEAEEDVDFIDGMSRQGWKIVEIQGGCRFIFVPCEQGEYRCQTAFTMKKSGFFDKQKCRELSDALIADGAEIVRQTQTLGTRFGIYAIRKTSLGSFEINTDIDSKIADYKQRRDYYTALGTVFFCGWVAMGGTGLSLWGNGFEGFAGVAGASFLWLILAFTSGFSPASRYGKKMKQLQAERDALKTQDAL